MSSKSLVVIEVNDGKVVRQVKWTRNNDGELVYNITEPYPIRNITSPETVSLFWTTIAVKHQFYDLKNKKFSKSPNQYLAEQMN